MNDREKIIDKVRKLRDHATSAEKIGSEAEAQAFAAAMQRLMSENKILMDEIEHAKLDETQPMTRVYTDGRVPRGSGKWENRTKARIEWMECMGNVIAKAHYCRLVVISKSSQLIFIGREGDARACLTAFLYLIECAANLAHVAYGRAYAAHTHGEAPWTPGFHRSYLLGFAVHLKERYDEELEKMKAEWAQSGTALMRITDALVDVGKWMDKQNGFRMTNAIGVGVRNKDAYDKGRKAASDLKLRGEAKGIGGQKKIGGAANG